jgi:hypothetical protein
MQQVKSRIVPFLFIAGVGAGLVGVISLAVQEGGVMLGLLILFAGVGAIAMAQLLELLMEIANHLAAIRNQVGRGVLGLLG